MPFPLSRRDRAREKESDEQSAFEATNGRSKEQRGAEAVCRALCALSSRSCAAALGTVCASPWRAESSQESSKSNRIARSLHSDQPAEREHDARDYSEHAWPTAKCAESGMRRSNRNRSAVRAVTLQCARMFVRIIIPFVPFNARSLSLHLLSAFFPAACDGASAIIAAEAHDVRAFPFHSDSNVNNLMRLR